jgi:methanethiol S-methyltransferase
MHDDAPAYGLWSLVIINSAIFIFFAFTFFKPQTKRDWRSFGAFSAFLVALFAEMYGFPLTIYLLSGWLQSRYPNVDWFSHDAGHLLEMMFGWKANPHAGPFHLLSFAFIGGGFIVISAGWKVLYEAQRQHALATTGIYSCVRHPQYVGFILVMFGFLLQWPTLLTLAMFRCSSLCMCTWHGPRSGRRSPSSAQITNSICVMSAASFHGSATLPAARDTEVPGRSRPPCRRESLKRKGRSLVRDNHLPRGAGKGLRCER